MTLAITSEGFNEAARAILPRYAWIFMRVEGEPRELRVGPARTDFDGRALHAKFAVPQRAIGKRSKILRMLVANHYGTPLGQTKVEWSHRAPLVLHPYDILHASCLVDL